VSADNEHFSVSGASEINQLTAPQTVEMKRDGGKKKMQAVIKNNYIKT